jgi:hypothetical protein
MLTENDLHYLRSIIGTLREVRGMAEVANLGATLGMVVLADNIDWLDCFIDKHQRELDNERERELTEAAGRARQPGGDV